MNHLGKENSFSFQRTIHALNEGLKLIIRGGMNMENMPLTIFTLIMAIFFFIVKILIQKIRF